MQETSKNTEYKIYKRRWAILTIFVLFCICNAIQWIQYSVIAHIFVKYYNVDYNAIDWTSLIFMLTFVIFILPATWLLNVKGLRLTVTIAMAGNCLGAWIKVLSVHPDRFWVTFIGQTIVAISQVYVMSTPAPVAATWFGPSQVATACAIGVIGLQLGNAIGFLLPPLIVRDSDVDTEIAKTLYYMFGAQAIICTIVLVLVIAFFKAQPPTPPSKVQAEKENIPSESAMDFLNSVWRVLRNPQFLMLFAAYGISQGVFYAILTYLTQMILLHYDYEGADQDAGFIGVTLMLVGLLGSVVCGFILDVTRKYKECCLALYVLSLIATIAFTLVVGELQIVYVYVAAGILGFVLIGYLPLGYEFAAEQTYPESEATSACVLALGSQIFSFIFTLVYGAIFDGPGDRVANWTMCGTLVIGLALSALNKSQYKRQNAGREHHKVGQTKM